MPAGPRPAVAWKTSPNFGPRRGGVRADMIVLHFTGMEDSASALRRLCDPASGVSAHYLICETGEAFQLVDEEMRAWHAGAGRWGPVSDVNSRSVGIELVNTGTHPFPAPQMTSLEALLPGIMDRWSIPPERVIGHSDMAPARKSDPGPRFDWRRLALQGLSVWPRSGCEAGGDFPALARQFGYSAEADETAILRAFRMRFRPWANGPADTDDIAFAADLARRFPVRTD